MHISDERNIEAPTYELHPVSEDPHIRGIRPDYTEPYDERQLVEKYPIFVRHTNYFRTFGADTLT